MRKTWGLAVAIAVLAMLGITAGDVPLAWDRSVSDNVTNYVVYAHTNQFTLTNQMVYSGTNVVYVTNIVTYTVRLNAGNVTGAMVKWLSPGRWYFRTTAEGSGLESDPSDELQVEVPAPPANLRTLAVQYSATLTNWSDIMFIRLAPAQ